MVSLVQESFCFNNRARLLPTQFFLLNATFPESCGGNSSRLETSRALKQSFGKQTNTVVEATARMSVEIILAFQTFDVLQPGVARSTSGRKYCFLSRILKLLPTQPKPNTTRDLECERVREIG